MLGVNEGDRNDREKKWKLSVFTPRDEFLELSYGHDVKASRKQRARGRRRSFVQSRTEEDEQDQLGTKTLKDTQPLPPDSNGRNNTAET